MFTDLVPEDPYYRESPLPSTNIIFMHSSSSTTTP